MAETIAKINKAEDFTKQQDYIKRCAQLLKIEESGLNNLVNKYLRERVTKEENRAQQQAANTPPPTEEIEGFDDDTIGLINRDEMHERGLVRCLIEFGLKEWEEGKTVADHIFEEFDDAAMMDNKKLVQMMDMYKEWYKAGIEPTQKNFPVS